MNGFFSDPYCILPPSFLEFHLTNQQRDRVCCVSWDFYRTMLNHHLSEFSYVKGPVMKNRLYFLIARYRDLIPITWAYCVLGPDLFCCVFLCFLLIVWPVLKSYCWTVHFYFPFSVVWKTNVLLVNATMKKLFCRGLQEQRSISGEFTTDPLQKYNIQSEAHLMLGNLRRISSRNTGRLLILFLLMHTVVTLGM